MMYLFQPIIFSSKLVNLLTIRHNDCYSRLDRSLSGGDIEVELLLLEYVGVGVRVFEESLLRDEEALETGFLSKTIINNM